jgi:hypothetical protein
MKKFTENDILISTLKAYPKVKIFVNNGNIYYNNTKEQGPQLNNFLQPQYLQDTIMLSEAGDILVTESGLQLITE